MAVEADEPHILVAADPAGDHKDIRAGLPFGTFDPLAHRTFEIGLRAWVSAQTAINVGYVEQLYTFGDRGRSATVGDRQPHVVSIGYLALTHMPENLSALKAAGAPLDTPALQSVFGDMLTHQVDYGTKVFMPKPLNIFMVQIILIIQMTISIVLIPKPLF